MASGSVWTTHRREVTGEVQGLVHGQLWQVQGVGHESKGNWSLPETICLLLQGKGKCGFNKTQFILYQLASVIDSRRYLQTVLYFLLKQTTQILIKSVSLSDQ